MTRALATPWRSETGLPSYWRLRWTSSPCRPRRRPNARRNATAAEDAALVVLGPTHRRSIARTLRGTARRLLAEAPCPVAVAPAGFADRPETPLQRIGVGYEPTPEGASALAEAHALAARAGSSLQAIGVVLPLAPLAYDDFGDVTPYLEDEYGVVEAGLERALAQLPATVPSIPDARVGDPAVELAAASAELDLLVCGTRRRSPLRTVVLGSVTERLLHGAACPAADRPAFGEPRIGARDPPREIRHWSERDAVR